MKFRKFGKTLLTAALSSAIVFSLSSCVRSFTVGYLYVTGTVTATPSGNGIITGFKIDNNTGKLVSLHGGIVSSGGANPVRIILLSGGRFVYVLNRGSNASGGSVCTVADPCKNANIVQYVVGGNGVLTPQQTYFTQGINPFRLIPDASGTYLFALDHDAPSGSDVYCQQLFTQTGCGDITVFAINSSTGRLSLVTNGQLTSSSGGTSVTYFPTPSNPVDFVLAGGYVMTVSGTQFTGQTVYPYSTSTGNGQLTVSSSVPQVINNGSGGLLRQATAIVYAGQKVYVLDNEAIAPSTTPGQIIPFTVGANGALSSLVGGAVADDATGTDPIYLILENKGKFVYVANQSGADASTGSTIAGFTLDPTSGTLSPTPNSPWGVGANPVCMLEDPSNQFIYTANSTGNSVTGRRVNPISGTLDNLNSSNKNDFALTGPASWCVATGRTN